MNLVVSENSNLASSHKLVLRRKRGAQSPDHELVTGCRDGEGEVAMGLTRRWDC
jgi:hypothetical protein